MGTMANLITTIEGLASGRQVVPTKQVWDLGGGGDSSRQEMEREENLDP